MVDEIWPSHKDKLELWELKHMQRHVAYRTMGHHHALAGGGARSERPVEDLPSGEMATPPASPRAAAAPDPTPDSGAFFQLVKAKWAAAGTSAAKRAIFGTIEAMPVGGARQRQGDRAQNLAQNLAQNPRIRGDDGSGHRIGDFLETQNRERTASKQGSRRRAASQTGKAAQKAKKKKKKTLKAGAPKGKPPPPKSLSARLDAAQARRMH